MTEQRTRLRAEIYCVIPSPRHDLSDICAQCYYTCWINKIGLSVDWLIVWSVGDGCDYRLRFKKATIFDAPQLS